MRSRRAALVIAALAVALVRAAAAAAPLPALGADAGATTVSGISSGGYMAVQLHVAHSATIRGAGVLAAGPYWCAQGSVWTAFYNCMTPGAWTPLPPAERLRGAVQTLAAARAIDPPAGLRESRVWLFGGTADRTVLPEVVDALERFYAPLVGAGRLARVRDVPAGHAMVTVDAGGACGVTASPFINDCDFDAAGRLLEHLYGPLAAPAAKPAGQVVAFDQRPFAGGDAFAISMDDTGFAYVPAECAAAACRIHVALHGCRQGVEAIGERFVRESGYNRWADANRIVVLYPQAIARNGAWMAGGRASFVWNPRGCWDWWGYTGALYHTQSGAQVRAIKGMVDRLVAPRGRPG
jgi:poly(3-hydroxybutyrate) depolymerase